MRNKFDEQLDKLHDELVYMGSLCEEAISVAVKALITSDKSLIENVFAIDGNIDVQEREIESLCLKLLLKQQPVASDLRKISSAMKMISDMERIGDQASDIAEITKHLAGHADIYSVQLNGMATDVIKMVTDSIDSFVKSDLQLARKVIEFDDTVDRDFDSLRNNLIDMITKDCSAGELCIDLIMVVKYLERIGDHAVNIAEWVEFSLTGIHRRDKKL